MADLKSTTLPALAGYHTLRILGRGAMGAVYEAVPFSDPTSRVAIKVIDQSGDISREVYLRFQKEAALMGQLYHPNIVTFLDLGAVKGLAEDDSNVGYFIVMELVRGENLKEIINSGLKPGEDLELLFRVGRQLASALDYTHGKNIIHRDIKPQNIVVSITNRQFSASQAKLLDFGVAGLSQARQYVGDGRSSGMDDFAGTPLYMAPEQSGLTHWETDHRVDIYSLGCVLFEILVGKPPFMGKTKEELKLKHLSEKPPNLRELRSDIPEAVCQLIQKCLEKDPEHRYQSAFSLYYDLHFIEQNWTQPGIKFDLGAFEDFNAINARFPLTGRASEFELLLNFYLSLEEETRSRISTVTGDSGSGKSRIIQEVRNFLVQRKVRFVSGSFSRHDSKVSFNALASAFDEYLLKVKRTQPVEAQRLKETFKEVLGPSLNELADVIPILKDFQDESSEKTEPSQRIKIDTFTKTFLDFTSCLMSDDQPMVFIFDDIHYSDDDSLKLIDDFFNYSNTQKIYLIISYKEEYLERRAHLRDFVDRIQKLKRRFQHIKLGNFQTSEISLMLKNLFKGEEISDFYLNWIAGQSKGNPLQVLEFSKSLIRSGKLTRSQKGWGEGLKHMNSLEMECQSTDLAISRLNSYSSEYLLILQYAAVAGMSFKAESVSVVSDFERDVVRSALLKAKSDALIIELVSLTYIFSHYEIREALVDGIPKSKLWQIHLDFAVQLNKEETLRSEQDVYSVSHHYNLAIGGNVKVSPETLSQALRSNMKSAKLAEKRKTYHFALEYYNKSLELIDNHPSLRSSDHEYAAVLASLSNVLIKQKDFDLAKVKIRKILDLNVSKEAKKSALFDGIRMNALQGRVSESLANARHLLGRTLPSLLSVTFARGLGVLVCDLASQFLFFRKLSSLSLLPTSQSSHLASRDHEILSIAFRLAARGQAIDAFKMQVVAGALAFSRKLNESDTISYLLDRVVILSFLGWKRTARRILFEISKVEGLSSHSRARLFLVKNIYFDFHHMDILKSIDYFIYRKGYHVLEWPEDGQYEAIHRGMSAWVLLKQGETNRAIEQASHAYRMLPVRNQAGTFGGAVVFLCLSFKGEREQLLKLGKRWLRRRDESMNRSNDIFAMVAASMIYITSGDRASCRDLFGRISREFESKFVKKNNFPHELDLLSFYFILFPFYFEYEFGSPIYESDSLSSLYDRFSGGFLKPKVSALYRDAFRLLSYDTAVDGQEAYDAWVDLEAKLAGAHQELLRVLVSTIVGLSLWKDFGKLPRISKAILKGHAKSRSLSLPLLTKAIESRLTTEGISFLKEDVSHGIANFAARLAYFPSTISEDLLDQISRADRSREGQEDLERAAALVDLHYGALAVYTLEGGRLGCALLKGEQAHGKLLQSIGPFASGSTTSFIPIADSSGDQVDGNLPSLEERKWGFNSHNASKPKGLFDETNIFLEFEGEEVTRKNEPTLDVTSVGIQQSSVLSASFTTKMGCLIPIKHWGEVLGYLFVNEIGELYKRDAAASRSELDYFGSILGSSLALQNSWISAADRVINHPDGSAIVEACEWLNVWFYGHLRRDRESTWYLGVNLSSDLYLMVYGQFQGKEEVRKRLSHSIWVSANAIISQQKIKSDDISLESVYQRVALHIQQNSAALSELTQLNLAFSLVSRQGLSVESAYLGSSKPWVVGGVNSQSAFNDAVATLDGYQKLLRYFHISSSLAAFHPILLSKDPSSFDRRVDAQMQASLKAAYRSLKGREPSGDQLHGALESVLGMDCLPRYYLGAAIKGA